MASPRIASQDQAGTSTTASVSATYPATPTANNTLFACVYSNVAAGVAAISGWTLDKEGPAGATANGTVSIFRKYAGVGEATAITATATLATVMRIQIYEYPGILMALPVDVSNSNTGGTTSMTSLAAGSITTTLPDVIFAAWGFNGATSAWSVDSGFNLLQTNGRLASADFLATTPAAINPIMSWTGLNRVGAAIVGYKSLKSNFLLFM